MPSSPTLLLVEDEALIALSTKMKLEGLGYRVTMAHDGERAIEAALGAERLDLALMDIDLGPGLDGIETARRILAARDVPVLFLSSHTEPEVVEKTEAVTSYGYVVKSSSVTVLDASIKMALKLFEAKRAIGQRDAALARSEEQYLALFRHSTNGVALHEMVYGETGEAVDYRFIAVNAAYEELVGKTAGELVGRTALEVFPDAGLRCVEAYGEVVRSGEPAHFVERSLRLGKLFEVRAFRTEPGRFATSCLDISERGKLDESRERELRRLRRVIDINQFRAASTQEFLNHTLEAAIDVTESRIGYIFHYDEESQLLTLNTWSREVMAACAVASPKTVYELGKTGIWGDVVRLRAPVIMNDFEAPHPHKRGLPEGHVALRRFMSVPVLRDGRIVAVAGVGNKADAYVEADALELQLLMEEVWSRVEDLRTEELLRFKEARHRYFSDTSPDGIVIADEAGRIVDWNPGMEKISGIKAGEILGRTVLEAQSLLGSERLASSAPGEEELGRRLAEAGRCPARDPVSGLTRLRSLSGGTRVVEERVHRHETPEGSYLFARLIDRTDEEAARQAQEKLNERLRLSELISKSGYIERNLDTGEGYWSDGVYALLGLEKTDATPDSEMFFARIHEEDRERIRRYQASPDRTRSQERTEFRVRRPDGSVIDVEGISTMKPDAETGQSVTRSVIRDITSSVEMRKERAELKKAATIAESGAESFPVLAGKLFAVAKALTGAAAGCVAMLDADRRGSEVVFLDSGGACRALDPSQPMPASGLRERAYRSKSAVYENALGREERLAPLSGGQPGPNNALVAPLLVDGEPIGLLGLADKPGGFDESDRDKAMEIAAIVAGAYKQIRYREELEAVRARFANVQKATNDGIWEWDIASGAVIRNGAYLSMLGLQDGNSVGDYPFMLERVHPEDRERVLATIDGCVRGDCEAFEVEHRLLHEDGGWRHVLRRGTASQRGADGRAQRLVGTLVDLTRLKETEEKLRETLSFKDTLMRELQHRVKNNINGAIGMMEMEAARAKAPEVRSMLEKSLGRLHSIASLYEQMYLSSDRVSIDLKCYLEGIIGKLRSALMDAGSVSICQELETVTVQPKTALPIGLILTELISNSLKHAFTGREKGSISVRLARTASEVRLVVADDGLGFPAGRDEGSPNSLGLTIVRSLAGQIGGILELDGTSGTVAAVTFMPERPTGMS